MMNTDEYKLQFEEYKIFRDTITHFDKILIDLRKNAISFAFTLFGAAIAAMTVEIPESLNFKFTAIDLSIVLISIELIMTLSFLYLDWHYRYYLLKIAESATEYEKKLNLGVRLEKCINYRDDMKCGKLASISKCLNCLHDGMESHIRAAHFNVYAALLAFGFIAFNLLMFIRIKLPFNDIWLYLTVILLIALGSPILYTIRNIKKQEKKSEFDDDSLTYIFSIFFFILLTYFFYFNISSFYLSFFGALLISPVIFFILGFRNKITPTNFIVKL